MDDCEHVIKPLASGGGGGAGAVGGVRARVRGGDGVSGGGRAPRRGSHRVGFVSGDYAAEKVG
jgi:hypothetical protein